MFLYESLSGLVGALVLIWLARRFAGRLRPGDLLLVFFIWYGAVRFAVESLKADNWTFFGVPTAQIVAALTVAGAAAILALRHRRQPGTRPPDPPPDTGTRDRRALDPGPLRGPSTRRSRSGELSPVGGDRFE